MLHDPDGIDEATYQRKGEYIVGWPVSGTLPKEDVEEATARITRKVRAHAITRTIVLRHATGKPGAGESTSEPPPAGTASSDSERR